MASSPWEGLRQAKADILVITRSRAERITARGRPLARMLSEGLPEVFALVLDFKCLRLHLIFLPFFVALSCLFGSLPSSSGFSLFHRRLPWLSSLIRILAPG